MTHEEILAQYGPREAMETTSSSSAAGPLAYRQPYASNNWRQKKARMSRLSYWKKVLMRAPIPSLAPSWTRRP